VHTRAARCRRRCRPGGTTAAPTPPRSRAARHPLDRAVLTTQLRAQGPAPSAPRQPSSSEYRRVVRLPGDYSFDMTPSSSPRSGASTPPRAAQCRDPVFHELHRPDEDGPQPRQPRRLRHQPHLLTPPSCRPGTGTTSSNGPQGKRCSAGPLHRRPAGQSWTSTPTSTCPGAGGEQQEEGSRTENVG
jgi:hypothetical protein